jgi:hypothetical protein
MVPPMKTSKRAESDGADKSMEKLACANKIPDDRAAVEAEAADEMSPLAEAKVGWRRTL